MEKSNREAALSEVLDRMDVCERAAGSTKGSFHKLERKLEALDAELLEYKRANGAKLAENYKDLKYWIK